MDFSPRISIPSLPFPFFLSFDHTAFLYPSFKIILDLVCLLWPIFCFTSPLPHTIYALIFFISSISRSIPFPIFFTLLSLFPRVSSEPPPFGLCPGSEWGRFIFRPNYLSSLLQSFFLMYSAGSMGRHNLHNGPSAFRALASFPPPPLLRFQDVLHTSPSLFDPRFPFPNKITIHFQMIDKTGNGPSEIVSSPFNEAPPTISLSNFSE